MSAHLTYLLHLADNALIHGQRLAEWTANAPTLEEDIALANQALDLIGQSRMLYQHAAVLEKKGRSEDDLAYFREAHEFRNFALLELPHFDAREGLLAATAAHERDFATTVARNFLYSAWMVLLWAQLAHSQDEHLAAIAQKSLKEVRYHFRASRDWVVRLGDGTPESHARMQAAFDALWRYTAEFFLASDFERAVIDSGIGCDVAALRDEWLDLVRSALQEATLRLPAESNAKGGFVSRGKEGVHTVHLGYVLAEMQSLARAHPGAVW
jgi:ring-1,2-phenylacetyl-CoA epoxidase subunit PaaC